MFDPFSDGYCPQCLLDDKKIPLVVYQMDFWECPSCRLQCVSDGVSVLSIIRERGDGQLKDLLATDWIKRFTLSRTRMNDITKSDGTTFRNEEELWGFLEKEVTNRTGSSKP
jgi:hypothetical protein